MTMRDIVIIGSGPAGYTAALYAARAGYQPLVLAGLLAPGGQLVNTTEVENYPGFPEGILGPELMDRMQQQAERFGAVIEHDEVESVTREDDGTFTLATAMGETVQARTLIVATGSQVRKLGVPGEEEFSGHGVSYCATCDGFFFKDKPIVVIGGGDSAMEEADFLSRYASELTLIHRRDSFRASQVMVDRVKANEKITTVMNTVVSSINGDDSGVKSLTLTNTATGETSELPASGVFIAIGHTPSTGFLGGLLDLDAQGYVLTQGASTRTSVPGVFAAGDVTDPVYQQAVSAAGMGCRAALDAQAYLSAL